jgi:hypothetical protein
VQATPPRRSGSARPSAPCGTSVRDGNVCLEIVQSGPSPPLSGADVVIGVAAAAGATHIHGDLSVRHALLA